MIEVFFSVCDADDLYSYPFSSCRGYRIVWDNVAFYDRTNYMVVRDLEYDVVKVLEQYSAVRCAIFRDKKLKNAEFSEEIHLFVFLVQEPSQS